MKRNKDAAHEANVLALKAAEKRAEELPGRGQRQIDELHHFMVLVARSYLSSKQFNELIEEAFSLMREVRERTAARESNREGPA